MLSGGNRQVKACAYVSRVWPLIANGILYELMWLAAVLAEQQYVVMLTLAFLLLHFLLVFPARLRAYSPALTAVGVTKAVFAEGLLVGLIALVGYMVDSGWFATGILQSPSAYPIAPVWLFCLWLAFATTFNSALIVLQQRWLVAALIGAVAGPLTYLSGAALNSSVHIGVSHLFFIVVMGAVWFVLFPTLLWFANRWAIWFGYPAKC